MKTIVLISLLIVLLLPNQVRINITLISSVIWAVHAVYYSYKLYKIKDKKVITSKYLETPPNNNYSPYIRYLYSGKVDYKVFLLIVLELLINDSIELKYENRTYYLVDKKRKDENLKKSETYVKKILFKDMGEGSYVILNNMIRKCNFNSGYLYTVYKEWQNVFEYEVAYSKYFKSNKDLVDKSTSFLIISFILCLYNIFFAKKIILAIIIFAVAASLCKYINDLKNREEEAQYEYEKWIEFNNYIRKYDNNLNELDIESLENYALYAYAMDSFSYFKDILNKVNKDIDSNLVLNSIKSSVFSDIDFIFSKSINKLNINAVLLFAKNKGRR